MPTLPVATSHYTATHAAASHRRFRPHCPSPLIQERITHDTHLFVVPFGTADPRQYYPNYRRPVCASSTSQALPSRRYEVLPLQAIRRARPLSTDVMAGTPPLTQCFVHPDISPSSTATPSSTPDDTMLALAPGQKERTDLVES
uniref:Uncharacterized protein n=1 Tax=Solanum tuberosum TaxID=4113 RepID=M1BDW5_SOLTU